MNPGQQLIYIGVEAVFVFVPRRSATPGMGMVAHQLPSSTQRLDSWRLWRTHYAPQERRADGQERAIQGLTRIPTRDPIRRVEADQHHNNWDIKRAVAQLWLEELQKEANAPDLWATIGQEKELES